MMAQPEPSFSIRHIGSNQKPTVRYHQNNDVWFSPANTPMSFLHEFDQVIAISLNGLIWSKFGILAK